MDHAALIERLSTLGVDSSGDRALDATITPETFAREASQRTEESVGPLPRIALSGGRSSSRAPAQPADAADYEIVGLIGEGGMGRVHLARQRSLGREVALKMLKDDVADASAAAMLRVEATIMGRLEHPNVVPVHAVGVDTEGRLVLVMKRIDGAPWRDLLRDASHPRWAALAPRVEDRIDAHLNVLTQVANALELAHLRGVVHRDVKPENVLLGSHGEVYLADWGVALRTEGATGQDLVGTPAYMAPEMVIGARAQIDGRTDVFLMGATLYEVLTGSPPYQRETLQATLLAAFDAEPPTYPASVPAELAAIATRAMARDPAQRFGSALELRRALDELRTHRGSIALTNAARAQLTSLEHTLADPSASRENVDRSITECRFALVSALREWPGNADAKGLLASCLRLAVRHEITRENASAARALLAELDGGDATLEREIEALAERASAKERELARLRSLDADKDLGVGMGARNVMFGSLVTVGMVFAAFVISTASRGHAAVTAWDVATFGGVLFGVVLTVLLIARRRLLANAIGRQLALLFVLATGGIFAHRLVAAFGGVPVETTLAMDLVMLGVIASAAGTVIPRAIWAGLPALVGVALATAIPGRAPAIFAVSMVGLFGGVMLAVARQARDRIKR